MQHTIPSVATHYRLLLLQLAEELHRKYALMANDGKHLGTDIPVADPETLLDLRAKLNQHLYKSEGTFV